jgi:hypothetical protein
MRLLLLNQDVAPPFALKEIVTPGALNSGIDVRWNSAAAASSAKALRCLRLTSEFRRDAMVDGKTQFMVMPRAASEDNSDTVRIGHDSSFGRQGSRLQGRGGVNHAPSTSGP